MGLSSLLAVHIGDARHRRGRLKIEDWREDDDCEVCNPRGRIMKGAVNAET